MATRARHIPKAWTARERALLMRLRDEEGLAFTTMVAHFEGRTSGQLGAYYTYVCRTMRKSVREMRPVFWNAERNAELLEAVEAARGDWDAVSAKFPGQTRKQVQNKYHCVKARAEMAAVAKFIPQAMAIPSTVEQDRNRRLALLPRSLTAALLGDPLPGFSALDRRVSA